MFRLFPRTPAGRSFIAGFLGGFAYAQVLPTLETRNPSYKGSWESLFAPGIIMLMNTGMAVMDPNFNQRDLPDHAVATALGFCAGYVMTPAAAPTPRGLSN